jgi:hypothetical protein
MHDRKKPSPHIRAVAPQMQPVEGTQNHILNQIVGGYAIAQQRNRISPKPRYFRDQQLSLIIRAHIPYHLLRSNRSGGRAFPAAGG